MDAHKFYVSLTDIEYNEETERLELASKYFIDDMELALGLEPGQHIKMPMDDDLLPLMSSYMKDHMQVTCDERVCEFEFLGYEIEDDVVWFYMESEKLPRFSTVSVTASQLTEHFDKQQNIVHISDGDVIQSLFLRKEKVSGSLTY